MTELKKVPISLELAASLGLEAKAKPMTTNTPADELAKAEAIKHAISDLDYVAGLEACLDEGQYNGVKNVRDLIAMVRWNANAHIAALRHPPHSDDALMDALVEARYICSMHGKGFATEDYVDALSRAYSVIDAALAPKGDV